MSESKKTQLDIKIEKRNKLLAEAAKVKKDIKNLEAKSRKAEREALRFRDGRVKMHAGGMLEMTGLLGYAYIDDRIRDNYQDNLIANLLVGILNRVSNTLESASVDELEKVWIEGRDFRRLDIADRKISELNPNLEELIERVEGKLSINYAKTTKQQPNDDVQSDVQTNTIEN